MSSRVSPETPQVEGIHPSEGKKVDPWGLQQPSYSLLEAVRYEIYKLKADKLGRNSE